MSEYRDTEHVVTHRIDGWTALCVGACFAIAGAIVGYQLALFVETKPLLDTIHDQAALLDGRWPPLPAVDKDPAWHSVTYSTIKPSSDKCDIVFTLNSNRHRHVISPGPIECDQARLDATTLYGGPEGVVTVEKHVPTLVETGGP